MAVGIGFDLHCWQETKPLWLGGVKVPFHKGLKAHSDGDVIIHALIDALLGATALGDIGELFPDTDERWKDIPSAELLKEVLAKIGPINIVNLDIVVILDEPKLTEYKIKIRQRLADLLRISVDKISVKAKTTEGLFSGGVSAIAVVQIATNNSRT